MSNHETTMHGMMLAQFNKLTSHASNLFAELDSTPPGDQTIAKLAELDDTLSKVQATTKLISEMAGVFYRFAEQQIIGPVSVRIPEADYRRLAGLDQGIAPPVPVANQPDCIEDMSKRDESMEGRVSRLFGVFGDAYIKHESERIKTQWESGNKSVAETTDAVIRAMRAGPIGHTTLPDDLKETSEYLAAYAKREQDSHEILATKDDGSDD